jgi:hypothetical protein
VEDTKCAPGLSKEKKKGSNSKKEIFIEAIPLQSKQCVVIVSSVYIYVYAYV